MPLQEISSSKTLKPGDFIQIKIKPRFSLGQTIDSYLMAFQLNSIENTSGWIVEGWDNYDGVLTVSVLVVDNPTYKAGITPAVIISAIVGLSIMFLSVTTYMVVDDVKDVIETPGGQTAIKTAAFTLPLMVVIGVGIGFWFYMRKK